ncbi:MAG TPA: aminotransferase class V-fold PLP-dependent enzyme [Sulfolobales archaeon]|nr:aminotransferase class V-fold PLP-dependent enzyme [Sulfolobales archaeon]
MQRIFTPGPVEPYREALEALQRPMISHRSVEFKRLLTSVSEKLSKLVRLDGVSVLLSGSGTLATEAMIYSIVAPGDSVLVISYGMFGDRLAESASRRGARVIVMRRSPGEPIDLGLTEDLIFREKISWVAVAHVETSKGHRLQELRALAELVEPLGARVLVDAVSSLGGEELVYRRGLGAIASCPHKALGSLPGVSFVMLPEDMVDHVARISREHPPPRYLDLSMYVESIARGSTPFTPAINVMYALDGALDRILRIGVEKSIEIHRERASILYRRLDNEAISPLIGSQDHRSNTVAVFKINSKDLSASLLVDMLEKKGYIIAPGLGEDRERLVRIGTMGNISIEDLKELSEEILGILGTYIQRGSPR